MQAELQLAQVVERARYQRGDVSLQRETDILKRVGVQYFQDRRDMILAPTSYCCALCLLVS